jgi:hypothetical protein
MNIFDTFKYQHFTRFFDRNVFQKILQKIHKLNQFYMVLLLFKYMI